jgi:GT2 family glycosyltransferase
MTVDSLWFRVYRDIGGDRYLSHAELPAELPAGRALWETYDRMFGRFSGASLDPLFFRFAHHRLSAATPLLPEEVPVLIVGNGPSLDGSYDELRRVRARVLVATSIRGAVALQARGLHADLVLIEHQTPFDAEISADARRHGGATRLHADTAVLADPATPPDLLLDADPGRCRLAHNLPTWGLWPATLAALALDGGAPMVGLLGIDLGADNQIDPAHRPLVALLERLADASGVCRDCGQFGTVKKGWARVSLAAFAGTATGVSQRVAWREERSPGGVFERGRDDLAVLQAVLPDARAALAMALQGRAGNAPAIRDLTEAIDLMLAWGADPTMRWVLQRGLGLSFLPRFWRTGVGVSQPRQLWRPLVLALQELTTQAERLARRVQDGPPKPAPRVTATSGADRGRATEAVTHATRISVLLPVKNGLPHLHDAVASLAAQTHPDLEILVIDDGSDDGGPQQVLAQALSHVRVMRSNGQGLAAALNTGLRAATGAFIARQDADDWSHPERLARQLHYLLRHPEIDILGATADLVDAEGRPIDAVSNEGGLREYDGVQTPEALAARLPEETVLLPGTVIARRDALRRAGGYRPGFAGAEDYDLWLRLLPDARVAKLPTRLYAYRVHARQASACEEVARESARRARAEYQERQAALRQVETDQARVD